MDDFFRFLYGESELWNEKLYGFAFRKNMFKRCVKAHEYNFELYQTKLAYGEECIQHELKAVQENDVDEISKLRSLAQHEMILQKDKSLLLWFYVIKINLLVYWLMGQDFVVMFVYRVVKYIVWYALDCVVYFFTILRTAPNCKDDE